MITKLCLVVVSVLAAQFVPVGRKSAPDQLNAATRAVPCVAQQIALGEGTIHQGVFFKDPTQYYSLAGDWTLTTVNGLKRWQPAGTGVHVVELGYKDEEPTIIEVATTGEVFEGDAVLLIDVLHQDHFQFASSSLPNSCDGSYSSVRGVTTSGGCWSTGIYDPSTECTEWRCNKNNENTCLATITFTDPETPAVHPYWDCGDQNDHKIISCPSGGGGTATVLNAAGGC